MPAAAARNEAIKNSMFPGAAMMYLVGTEAIHDLRRQIAEREGQCLLAACLPRSRAAIRRHSDGAHCPDMLNAG